MKSLLPAHPVRGHGVLRWFALLVGAVVELGSLGCAISRPASCPDPPPLPMRAGNGERNGEKDNDKEERKSKKEEDSEKKDEPSAKRGAKTLFEWAAGKEDKKKGDKNGNGNGIEEQEDRIVTDRPDFTEASVTVGRGRIQLESGYTFGRDGSDGSRMVAHSYPEMLWRIGLFADWFELRVGQNFFSTRETTNGVPTNNSGADDLYLGVKLALAEQKGWLPETGIILQMTVPTGARAFTSDQVLPGVDLLYGWDIIKDCLSLGGSTQINRTRTTLDSDIPEDASVSAQSGHPFIVLAQSLTVGYTLTRRLGAFTEWFAFFPHSSTDPTIGPEYYLDGGFTYLVTNNFQLDIRAGVGLNEHADDFFTGAGFAVRY